MIVEPRTDKKGRPYYYVTAERNTYREEVYGPSPFVSATVFPSATEPDWMAVYVWWQREGVSDYDENTGEIVTKRQRWVQRYLAKRFEPRTEWDTVHWLPVPFPSTRSQISVVAESIRCVERLLEDQRKTNNNHQAEEPF